jgi:hypothetical protein
MQWTMPHRVLQIVASLIALAAVSAFALGIVSAPQRGGRLPGEKAPGVAGTGAAIDAEDATPLSNERIEGPPPPAANDEAKDEDKEEADAGNADADQASGAAPAPAAAANQTPLLKPLKPVGAGRQRPRTDAGRAARRRRAPALRA